jgi:hypothetical protein
VPRRRAPDSVPTAPLAIPSTPSPLNALESDLAAVENLPGDFEAIGAQLAQLLSYVISKFGSVASSTPSVGAVSTSLPLSASVVNVSPTILESITQQTLISASIPVVSAPDLETSLTSAVLALPSSAIFGLPADLPSVDIPVSVSPVLPVGLPSGINPGGPIQVSPIAVSSATTPAIVTPSPIQPPSSLFFSNNSATITVVETSTSVVLPFDPQATNNVLVSFGGTQDTNATIENFKTLCADLRITMINLAFLKTAAGSYKPNVGYAELGPDLATVVANCQDAGKKVFVSLPVYQTSNKFIDPSGNVLFGFPDDAASWAQELFNTFGPRDPQAGSFLDRPLGHVAIDGIELFLDHAAAPLLARYPAANSSAILPALPSVTGIPSLSNYNLQVASILKFFEELNSLFTAGGNTFFILASLPCTTPYILPLGTLIPVQFITIRFWDSVSCAIEGFQYSDFLAWAQDTAVTGIIPPPTLVLPTLSAPTATVTVEVPDATSSILVGIPGSGLPSLSPSLEVPASLPGVPSINTLGIGALPPLSSSLGVPAGLETPGISDISTPGIDLSGTGFIPVPVPTLAANMLQKRDDGLIPGGALPIPVPGSSVNAGSQLSAVIVVASSATAFVSSVKSLVSGAATAVSISAASLTQVSINSAGIVSSAVRGGFLSTVRIGTETGLAQVPSVSVNTGILSSAPIAVPPVETASVLPSLLETPPAGIPAAPVIPVSPTLTAPSVSLPIINATEINTGSLLPVPTPTLILPPLLSPSLGPKLFAGLLVSGALGQSNLAGALQEASWGWMSGGLLEAVSNFGGVAMTGDVGELESSNVLGVIASALTLPSIALPSLPVSSLPDPSGSLLSVEPPALSVPSAAVPSLSVPSVAVPVPLPT